MPSYRLRLEVGAMRPGASPADVVPTAERGASARAFVEAKDVDVSGGSAWVQLRVTIADSSAAEEDATARATLDDLREAVGALAQTGRGYILRKYPGGRWAPVPTEVVDPDTGELR